MATTLDLARVEAVLLLRHGGRVLPWVAAAAGALALIQDPAFARRQHLDLAWSSVDALLVLIVSGGLPWLWLSAQSTPTATSWIVRSPAPCAKLVGAAWLGLVSVGIATAATVVVILFTLDRILGGEVALRRVLATVGVAASATAVLSAWGLALRWLAPGLPTRAALWLVGLALVTRVVRVDLPVPFSLGAPCYSLALSAAAGLLIAHALLSRRRAVRH